MRMSWRQSFRRLKSPFDQLINPLTYCFNGQTMMKGKRNGWHKLITYTPFQKIINLKWGIKGSFREITNDFLVEELQQNKWNSLDGAKQ